MDFKNFLESKRSDIANLQSETVISVFHGTDMKVAYLFCINGIDARHVNYPRVYSQHMSGGKRIKFGLFIAPDLKTAFKFGLYVVKFKTKGKNLIDMFPAEMKKSNQYAKTRYPNSFRPIVSQNLLDLSVEPQALFIGLESPRAIEKVYVWKQGYGHISMTREEFIAHAEEKNPKWKYEKSIFEPQEYKMNLHDFVRKIVDNEGGSEEEVLEILKNVYKKYGYLTGVGDIPYSLLRRIEAQIRTLLKRDA